MSCGEKHARDDTRLGEPLCPECYDYTGAALFNHPGVGAPPPEALGPIAPEQADGFTVRRRFDRRHASDLGQ
jgi:hypothetical protein